MISTLVDYVRIDRPGELYRLDTHALILPVMYTAGWRALSSNGLLLTPFIRSVVSHTSIPICSQTMEDRSVQILSRSECVDFCKEHTTDGN